MAFLSTSIPDVLARLRAGMLVALPTETVYGLAGDACSEAAIAQIYALKGRPSHNPLIVHVTGKAMAQRYVKWNALAESLAAAHWPGALTLVLPRAAECPLAPAVMAGGDSVAIRCPAFESMQTILTALGSGLAAPSANRSGRISPTCAAHVLEEFADAELMVLDGGVCSVGIESTVVDCTGDTPKLLRPGSIAIASAQPPHIETSSHPLKSPGMMASHYAPQLPVRLNATQLHEGEALLAFGTPIDGARETLNLSAAGDLEEAAYHLFAMLRALDKPAFSGIAVMPIPNRGVGIAINDRLRRAAAPRNAPCSIAKS